MAEDKKSRWEEFAQLAQDQEAEDLKTELGAKENQEAQEAKESKEICDRIDDSKECADCLGIEKVGRKTKYKTKFDDSAYKLCLLGAIDKEIADFFDVCERTLNYWKKEHESFKIALQNGKIIADTEIAQRLYKRAYGYEYFEETEEMAPDTCSPTGFAVRYKKRVKKEMPPDTGACMAWLKNRRPENWRETKAVELNMNQKLEDFL